MENVSESEAEHWTSINVIKETDFYQAQYLHELRLPT
jgi:hypothetical protein